MDFATILSIVGMLGFAATLLVFVGILLTNSKDYSLLKYPLSLCWPYLIGLIMSDGELAYIEDSGDEFFYFLVAAVSIASAGWVIYLICKKILSSISNYIEEHPLCISQKLKLYISNLPCSEDDDWHTELLQEMKIALARNVLEL